MSSRPLIPFILATAGHVDHGKSSLVTSLTGIDPDRLPEEKQRGITIDLGFAHLQLPSPAGVSPTVDYQIGIVDVPGHEDFVKNMVAGVGSIDAALLVVSADDGWMPQTEEHFQILRYLGVERGVIALTKIDLATDAEAATNAVRQHLTGTPFECAPIIPTSTKTGQGIDALKNALAGMFAAASPQRDIGKPRLPVDRVFSLKGIGTIVTGTLTGGELRQGQQVCVQPSSTPTRIRSMQTHNHDVSIAVPGSRVALNLADVSPATQRAKRTAGTVARGDVITLPVVGDTLKVFDAVVERCDNAASPRLLKHNTMIRVHHGSGGTAGRITLFDSGKLEASGRSLARFVMETPIFVLIGDRFVIRDWPEQHTLAGGIVLDTRPSTARNHRPIQGSIYLQLLESRAAAPGDPAVLVRSQLERDGIASRQIILSRSRFDSHRIDQVLHAAIESGDVVSSGDLLVDAKFWSETLGRAERIVDDHHQKHPEQTGLPLADLRASLSPLDAKLIDAIVDNMSRDGFQASSTIIRRHGHRITLPARMQNAGERLRKQLADHPFDPPSKKELCPDDRSYEALRFLIAAGEAIAISPELVLSAQAFAQSVQIIREYLRSHEAGTVSELKALLRSSRRVMVPLLEKLDRDKITARHGDLRSLNLPG
jgi:selenocysteine-specific elongation factor